MDKFLITIFSIFCGAVGFLFTNFWFQPILRYRQIKSQIISDIVFYANAINPENLNDEMKQRVIDRMVSNRKHSADLTACFYNLPSFYRFYLRKRGEKPDFASREFMGLSNTTEYESANRRIDKIQELLKIIPKVD